MTLFGIIGINNAFMTRIISFAQCIDLFEGQIRRYIASFFPQIGYINLKIFYCKHKIPSLPIFQANSIYFKVDENFVLYNSINVLLFANYGSCRRFSTQEVEWEVVSQTIQYVCSSWFVVGIVFSPDHVGPSNPCL